MVRVYLDTCVWCRLFDVLDHERIKREFIAVTKLIDAARKGKIYIMNSEVVYYEISKIEGEERYTVERLIQEISVEKIVTTKDTKKTFEALMKRCGLNAVDALHLAVAAENNIDLFLTTDDEILNKRDCINNYGIEVKNPVDYEVE